MASRPASHVALTFAAVIACASPAFATWSVVAVDQGSGTMVVASAACVAQAAFATFPASGLMDIQAIVVPGRGVAVAQAAVDATRANQELIAAELGKGTAPSAIVELLKQDPNLESRQFGIADVQGRTAAFSGSMNGAFAISRQDRVPGTGIYFSVQGNQLADTDVVIAAVSAIMGSSGTLADRVMLAMEAGDAKGGDRRCTCATAPRPSAPCETKTAHVAYLLRAEAADRPGNGINTGVYAMYLSVTNQDIMPSENANPIKTLRTRYDAWKKAHPR